MCDFCSQPDRCSTRQRVERSARSLMRKPSWLWKQRLLAVAVPERAKSGGVGRNGARARVKYLNRSPTNRRIESEPHRGRQVSLSTFDWHCLRGEGSFCSVRKLVDLESSLGLVSILLLMELYARLQPRFKHPVTLANISDQMTLGVRAQKHSLSVYIPPHSQEIIKLWV